MRLTTFIYVLKDPDTGEIRYVGKTNYPTRRMNAHFSHKSESRRGRWIDSLKCLNKRPLIEIIDEVLVSDWQQWEIAWIEYFRDLGCDLVNSTLGGNGNNGVKHSAEWNSKISRGNAGKEIPVEMRNRIAKTLTGLKTSRNTSGFVGVSKSGKYWQAAITVNRRTKSVGYFLNLEDAIKARETAVKERIENVRSF